MSTTETRIGLVRFTCDGCDCGACVGESIKEIDQVEGVVHVRVDRSRKEIVVRHEADTVSRAKLSGIVGAKGLALRES